MLRCVNFLSMFIEQHLIHVILTLIHISNKTTRTRSFVSYVLLYTPQCICSCSITIFICFGSFKANIDDKVPRMFSPPGLWMDPEDGSGECDMAESMLASSWPELLETKDTTTNQWPSCIYAQVYKKYKQEWQLNTSSYL